MAAQLLKSDINFVKPESTIPEVIDHQIRDHVQQKSDDAFFICDLGDVTRKYKVWKRVFPRIKPFYGRLALSASVACRQSSSHSVKLNLTRSVLRGT
ncbi:hypothetical protein EB796_004537 [Bugula neritina]|uniref:Uncharacterized protein n=1 Tax=Bugula neritina TaxID=10212 RepID=A0A7J7KER6_BUGNE|nr:hypothetical protein EB796_004537 [Bugula neritina]